MTKIDKKTEKRMRKKKKESEARICASIMLLTCDEYLFQVRRSLAVLSTTLPTVRGKNCGRKVLE